MKACPEAEAQNGCSCGAEPVKYAGGLWCPKCGKRAVRGRERPLRASCERAPNRGEVLFLQALLFCGVDLPKPLAQYELDPKRRWRADFCWPEHALIVEISGQVHNIKGRSDLDFEKSNEAQLAGWLYLQFTPRHLTDDPYGAVETVRRALMRGNVE